MKKKTVWIFKGLGTAVLMLLLAGTLAMPVFAKTYSENGTWYRKINGTKWYFDVNDYTDIAPGSKALGVVYIYKGKANFNKRLRSGYGEYYKRGTNKYVLKYKGVRINFKVKKKSIVVSQIKGRVNGRKLKGTFKLLRRHYA